MNWKKLWTKISFENRLIRFLAFDLLIGIELSGIEMSDSLAMINGIVALYLLLTSVIGRCPVQQSVIYFLEYKGFITESGE